MKKWDDLSSGRKAFDGILCVVAFLAYLFGATYASEPFEKLEQAKLRLQEAQIGAKKGTVRLTRAFPVVSHEFKYHWWGDKVILQADINGKIEFHEYRLHKIFGRVEIHKSDTGSTHLKFEEKLVYDGKNLTWKKQTPEEGKVHLFIPTV